MNPFLLPPRERLVQWKSLRNGLHQLPEDEQLATVARFWAQCPVQRYSLDPERPMTWPTPWEMIHLNDFDQNAIAIGMEMTLRLAGWEANRLTLMMLRDWQRHEVGMVLKIDDNRLLNYSHAVVSGLPTGDVEVLYQYRFNKRRYTPFQPTK